MKRNLNILWGLLLIGGGVLLLLQNMGYLHNLSGYLWALILGGLGVAFLVGFSMDRTRWWAIIPGVVILSIGVLVALTTWNSERFEPWAGSIVLGGVALAFIIVYIFHRDFWWALIPAGTLATLAVVAGAERTVGGLDSGAIFFIGLAATFGVVLLVTRMRWAIFPAAALALIAVFILVGQSRFINYIWPVALIAVGLFLLLRVWRPVNR